MKANGEEKKRFLECVKELTLYDILEKEDHDKIMQICFKAVIRHGKELKEAKEK